MTLDPTAVDAAYVVVMAGMGSWSMLQRKLHLTFARALRTMDDLEALGIVGPANPPHQRDVLITLDELDQIVRANG